MISKLKTLATQHCSFIIFCLFVSQPSFANDADSFIKNLSGCFKVQFRYVEDGKNNKVIGGLYEWAGPLPGGPGNVIQHIGIADQEIGKDAEGKPIYKSSAFKHWSEEWVRGSDDTWKQIVLGTKDELRYICSSLSPIEFNQIRCTAHGTPKPRRDIERKDYETLDRENIIQSTAKGVVQVEVNVKRDKNGQAVSNEVGWNEYIRVDEQHCQPAIDLIPKLIKPRADH